jgi:hypothetical protein
LSNATIGTNEVFLLHCAAGDATSAIVSQRVDAILRRVLDALVSDESGN